MTTTQQEPRTSGCDDPWFMQVVCSKCLTPRQIRKCLRHCLRFASVRTRFASAHILSYAELTLAYARKSFSYPTPLQGPLPEHEHAGWERRSRGAFGYMGVSKIGVPNLGYSLRAKWSSHTGNPTTMDGVFPSPQWLGTFLYPSATIFIYGNPAPFLDLSLLGFQ